MAATPMQGTALLGEWGSATTIHYTLELCTLSSAPWSSAVCSVYDQRPSAYPQCLASPLALRFE